MLFDRNKLIQKLVIKINTNENQKRKRKRINWYLKHIRTRQEKGEQLWLMSHRHPYTVNILFHDWGVFPCFLGLGRILILGLRSVFGPPASKWRHSARCQSIHRSYHQPRMFTALKGKPRSPAGVFSTPPRYHSCGNDNPGTDLSCFSRLNLR